MSTATADDLDTQADNVPAGAGYGAKDLKKLPDGDYSFEINTAVLKETKAGERMFKLDLTVFDGEHAGDVVEQCHFLTKDQALNTVSLGIFRKDLKTMGFDEANWLKPAGRPFFGELAKATLLMPGIRFKGKKVTGKGGYANLYVNERLADGKSPTFGPAELESAAKASEAPFEV